ncbi:hypothetical protein Cme02nite_72690 [Catellatospora methionotrophica]|uniref:DUF4240 domain-containing protein n=1 Tax=Catellatospora methionotrophica TaxID=121620 RepID=A0A8J3LGK1_9ACTN|nr:DUF4240 domain-containing protein [Catellatospora methionotrophica]GIG18937.1 hypothetical protein Cme02nite_72690 [Catellatospora methionotrophica]
MPRDDIDDFWDLVEQVRTRTGRAGFCDALARELGRRPIPQIARFHATMMRLADRAARWELLAAADLVFARCGGCSTDTFHDFRLWLVHLGRDVFEDVLADPDALAELPEIAVLAGGDWSNAAFPAMGEVCGVAEQAFEIVLGRLPPAVAAAIVEPAEFEQRPCEEPCGRFVSFGAEEGRSRFPRLTEMFGS